LRSGRGRRLGFRRAHEEAEARDAGDAAFERGADAIGEEGGDVARGGVALGGHRLALGFADVLRGFFVALPSSLSVAPSSPSFSARMRARWMVTSA
jgi:hypothetical protein